MLIAVEGIYKNGTVEFLEKPDGAIEGKVLIVFLESPQTTVQVIEKVKDAQGNHGWFGRVRNGASAVSATVGAAAGTSGQFIANTASGAYGVAGNVVSHVYEKAAETGTTVSQHTYPLLLGLTTQAGSAVELVTGNPTIRQLAQTFRLEHWLDVSEHVDIENAQEVVTELKAQFPDELPKQIAHRLMMQKAIYAGGVGLSTSLMPGAAIPLMAVDLAGTALLQAELVYQIAATYDLDESAPGKWTRR
jgi:hypothetical protein